MYRLLKDLLTNIGRVKKKLFQLAKLKILKISEFRQMNITTLLNTVENQEKLIFLILFYLKNFLIGRFLVRKPGIGHVRWPIPIRRLDRETTGLKTRIEFRILTNS